MDRSGWITLAVLVTVVMLVIIYSAFVNSRNAKEVLETSVAADALVSAHSQYSDLEGNPVSLNDYVGQTVVTFTWASWCSSCKDQLQVFNSLDLSDDIVIIGFNRAESVDTINSYLEFYNLTDLSMQLVVDPGDHFYKTVGGYAMPETVVFDREGAILHHARTNVDTDSIIEIVTEAEAKYLQN